MLQTLQCKHTVSYSATNRDKLNVWMLFFRPTSHEEWQLVYRNVAFWKIVLCFDDRKKGEVACHLNECFSLIIRVSILRSFSVCGILSMKILTLKSIRFLFWMSWINANHTNRTKWAFSWFNIYKNGKSSRITRNHMLFAAINLFPFQWIELFDSTINMVRSNSFLIKLIKKNTRFHIYVLIIIFQSWIQPVLFGESVLYGDRRDVYDNRRWRLTFKWKVIVKLIIVLFNILLCEREKNTAWEINQRLFSKKRPKKETKLVNSFATKVS